MSNINLLSLGGTWEENFDGTTMQCAGIVENENLIAAAFDEDFTVAKDRARRIVACANVCAGKETEDLEAMAGKDIFTGNLFSKRVAIEKERGTYRDLCAELVDLTKAMFSTTNLAEHVKAKSKLDLCIEKAEAILGGK